jgi:hypothetical protein
MDQAQGAIDAARAAGAELYAPMPYGAATDALKQANDAVAARDYRLALNLALESREQAQLAAGEAADTRARVRGDVERSMAELMPLTERVRSQLAAARKIRIAAGALRPLTQALTSAEADVQKAGEAVKKDDYLGAQPLLQGAKAQIEKTLADLDALITAQSRRQAR